MSDTIRYTILKCKHTGRVGITRKAQASERVVLVCVGRYPPSYVPMKTKDTITLGWVTGTDITSAFFKIPESIRN